MSNMKYMTTGEVSKESGMTIQKVRTLCEIGKLPAVNTSTGSRPRWTIRRCDFEAFMTPDSVLAAEKRASKKSQRIDAGVPKVFG